MKGNYFLFGSIALSGFLLIILIIYFIFLNFNIPTKSKIILGEPFSLINQNEIEVTDKIFLQKPSIIFFGFTHCPEVCPTTLYEISSWLDLLEEDQNNVQAIFITLDPKRDTAKLLNEYLSNFNNTFIGITGNERKIASLAKSWGIYRKVIPLDGDDYSLDHTATVFLVNNDGSLHGTITYREPLEVAVEKVKNLLDTNK